MWLQKHYQYAGDRLASSSLFSASLVACLLFSISILLSGCTGTDAPQKQTITTTSSQSVTYSTNARDVVLRTFLNDRDAAQLSLAPQVSIYGDGSYVLGTHQQGHITGDTLQKLIKALVNTDGLLKLSQKQFMDVPDQNATYLELTLNGSTQEFVYGSFGNQIQNKQAMTEYQHLGQALNRIKDTLQGDLQPYTAHAYVVLVHQIFLVNTEKVHSVLLPDLLFSQLATFECGPLPEDKTSFNQEAACLKYTLPSTVQLLTDEQVQKLKIYLNDQLQGIFVESGYYYQVQLRPLLADESNHKLLAMFGCTQQTYQPVSIHEGPLPEEKAS